MTSNPLENVVPPHIIYLLSSLHAQSESQKSAITRDDIQAYGLNVVMRDKLIALHQDKAYFLYQMSRSINAKNIVEAGTSYGVSTVYLALAASANVASTGGQAKVIATEHEQTKAQKAKEIWEQCGSIVSGIIELREGDVRETLKEIVEHVDLLLLDIWTSLALPTLKLVEPRLRYGAVVITDSIVKAAEKYRDLLNYLHDPHSGFTNVTLPYTDGLLMSVYLPRR